MYKTTKKNRGKVKKSIKNKIKRRILRKKTIYRGGATEVQNNIICNFLKQFEKVFNNRIIKLYVLFVAINKLDDKKQELKSYLFTILNITDNEELKNIINGLIENIEQNNFTIEEFSSKYNKLTQKDVNLIINEYDSIKTYDNTLKNTIEKIEKNLIGDSNFLSLTQIISNGNFNIIETTNFDTFINEIKSFYCPSNQYDDD
jgi:hypothetical protein